MTRPDYPQTFEAWARQLIDEPHISAYHTCLHLFDEVGGLKDQQFPLLSTIDREHLAMLVLFAGAMNGKP